MTTSGGRSAGSSEDTVPITIETILRHSTGRYNVSRGYQSNAKNQYTQVGVIAPVYDVKGNLTQAGGATFGYSSKNELVGSSWGPQVSYDPLGRLDRLSGAGSGPAGPAGFHYDGKQVANETQPGTPATISRRYVWGPGDDEPLL